MRAPGSGSMHCGRNKRFSKKPYKETLATEVQETVQSRALNNCLSLCYDVFLFIVSFFFSLQILQERGSRM